VHTELEELEPDAVALWRAGEKAWNGGESYDEMSERVVGAVLRIAGQHPGATLLFVTHGGSIRACRAAAAGVTYAASRLAVAGALANCAVVELRVADGRLAQLIG
jgi:broad specificity phosphatase PhoE